MKYEWSIKKLSEITYINPKESIKKGVMAKKVSMDKLKPFYRDIPDFSFEEYKGGTKFRDGDTIMARITPCLENGKIAKVSILNDDEVGFGSTEYIVFRAIEGICDSDFLYYLISSPLVRKPAIQSMVGSSGRQRVQTDVVASLRVAVPPMKEQRRIGSFLKALDDKIALNNAINNNLEQQAQAIFADNFLSHKTLPKNWKQASLAEIANYLNGLAMQKHRPTSEENGIPVLKIKELRQRYCDNNSDLCSPNIQDKYIIRDGDVIFSWSGSLLIDFWCGGICGLNQHLFKVTSCRYDKWFYYAWTKHHLNQFKAIAEDKATTMGHIKRNDLEKARVYIPDEADYDRIGDLLYPIYNLIIANRMNNKKLVALRNALLPKLMSGELDVSNLDL